MAYVLAPILGVSALAWASRQSQFDHHNAPAPKRPTVAVRFGSTGAYGEMADISSLIHHPGWIVGERYDKDLTGVPCRWLELASGQVVKTYDLHTKFP